MASITFLPGSVPIETLNGSPGQQNATGAPTTNPNQAQNAPAPQDTVVLTGKVSEAALNGENPNGSQFQEMPLFFAARGIFLGAGNAAPGAPQAPQAPPAVSAQTGAPAIPAAAPANSADPAIAAVIAANSQPPANSGGTSNPGGAVGTPQQQLAQLDQTLQQLGINPQTLSLADRMGMLLYANDPAALRVMVQEIQSSPQQAGEATANAPAVNQGASQVQAQALLQTSGQAPPANPAQAQVSTQLAAAAQVQNQNTNSPGGASIELATAQFALNQTPASFQENNAANQNAGTNQTAANSTAVNSAAVNTNAQSNNATFEFERLQFSFSEIANQASEFANQNGAPDSASQGQTLNVTA